MDEAPPNLIVIEVPLTPPSVNHYKKPIVLKTSNGLVRSYALTPEAIAFREAVAIFARGRSLSPATDYARSKVRYSVACTVFLGEKQRGDGDNFGKCVLDSLQHAGVIHSDARVRTWHVEVDDEDRKNPRTLICATTTERKKTLAEYLRDKMRGAHGS